MVLNTKYFGPVEYEQADCVTFPVGLYGFEDEHSFLLLPFESGAGNLLCLQSIQTPPLAFIAMNPFSLQPDYNPHLSPQELEDLGVRDSGELGYYVLCVVREPVKDTTVNLKCPVAVNPETRVARQIILETDIYEMRHPLSQFKQQEEGAPC